MTGILARVAIAATLVVGSQRADVRAAEGEDEVVESRSETVGKFFAGAAVGLGAHEGAHLLFDSVFAARPYLKKVEFKGLPFFAIAHRGDLSPRHEFVISSAGFWMQHATDEWLLVRHPGLRHERRPYLKGLLAFNILTSVAYAGAALARAGPVERDTRGMAAALRVSEPYIGLLVLAPAILDGYRYMRPGTRWATWSSRAVKAGIVFLVLR